MKRISLWKVVFIYLTTLVCFPDSILYAQTLINQEWVSQYGLPDTITWSASTTDADGNLYTTGNTFVAGNGADVLLTKYDPEGVLLWQTTYDFSNLNDYGVDILLHSNGDIFLVAALASSSSGYDFGLINYSSNGTLIGITTFDNANDDDIPTDISEDVNGNIYCLAVTNSASSDLDYLTLKFSTSGSLIWSQLYDFVGGRDVPVSLIASGSSVTVTGASEDSTGNWDFYTVMYDDLGNAIEEYRLNKPGLGFDEPSAIARDGSGNFFLTGRASNNGTDYYTQTVKLDPQLNLLWEEEYDPGNENGSTAIGIDDQGSVYICGYKGTSPNQEILLIKYDPNGNLEWAIEESSETPGTDASATAMHVFQEEIFITGYKGQNSQDRIYVAAFTVDGKKIWEKEVEEGEYLSNEIITNGTNAYVTGQGFQNGNYQYVALKFAVYDKPYEYIYKTNGDPDYIADEVIIKFPPLKIDQAFVNNTDRQFGTVSDIITDPNMISTIDQALSANGTFQDWMMYKIYPNVKTTDTTALSRSGNVIKVPSLWSSFILKLPKAPAPSFSPSSYDPLIVANDLDALGVETIIHAHPNYIFQIHSAPNDPRYVMGEQKSLFNNDNPPVDRSHINCLDAWTFLSNENSTIGNSSIKVGIYDTGIEGRHEDLKLGSGNNLNSTLLDGGFEYLNSTVGVTIPSNSTGRDYQSHGSRVAGVIGALRNNSLGIAGIAGGDIDGNASEGVHFISMTIFDESRTGPMSQAISAIGDAVLQNGMPLFDIMNNSYGYEAGSPDFNPNNIAEYRDVMRLAFQAEIIMVNSRGNDVFGPFNPMADGDVSIIIPANMSPNDDIPASIYDDWGISVGASDRVGELHKRLSGQGDESFSSDFGREMDLIAPGITELVTSLDIDDNSTVTNGYSTWNGTSASAPHVAGAAALLLNYSDMVLSPEDVEHILELGALSDKGPSVSFDEETGWGLLDVDASLKLIQKPNHQVLHFTALGEPIDVVQAAPTFVIDLQYDYVVDNTLTLQAGQWTVTPYKYMITNFHNLGPNVDLVTLGLGKLPYWVRNSSSNLWGPSNNLISSTNDELVPEIDARIVFADAQSATLEGYYYEFALSSNTSVIIPPGADTDAQISYSLLVNDPDAIPTDLDQEHSSFGLKVSPNPTSGTTRIDFQIDYPVTMACTVTDLQGKKVFQLDPRQVKQGRHVLEFDTFHWASGLYIVEMSMDSDRIYEKLIKE